MASASKDANVTAGQAGEAADARSEIDRLIAEGDPAGAHAALVVLWHGSPGPATANFVNTRYERLRGALPMTPYRVAILRSFTVEPILPLLRAQAFVGGIDLTVRLGDFNTYAQDILQPEGWLETFAPDAVILAAQTRDIAPALWDRFADLDERAAQAAADEAAEHLKQLIDAFRQRHATPLIVHTLQTPARRAFGMLDAQLAKGQRVCIAIANQRLAEACRAHQDVYLLDIDVIVARRGEANWHDERTWLLARMPIVAGEMIHLARAWCVCLHPLTGRIAKALVVDLDNTLWGGVIGEDGMDGIRLGPEHPGAAYQRLQRAVLDLAGRGIILAVCSKNNPAEAIEALTHHPGMLLRPKDFAAMRINWRDKATNLREIARELNIGTDAMAFLDDNPAERQWVRRQMPEVSVIELPDDPAGYADALRDASVFERLTVTAEDRRRSAYYAQERQRSELRRSAGTLEDFYRQLAMRVRVMLMPPEDLARTAQLTQKTNQFNLTTHRYTEQQIAAMAASPDCRVYTLRASDRYGDSGLVGVAIVRVRELTWEIDTFLLSCRVIGRTIETALLACLVQDARRRDAAQLVGLFCPTNRNAPAADFYESHGFARLGRREEDVVRWGLDLQRASIECPAWIDLEFSPASAEREAITT